MSIIVPLTFRLDADRTTINVCRATRPVAASIINGKETIMDIIVELGLVSEETKGLIQGEFDGRVDENDVHYKNP